MRRIFGLIWALFWTVPAAAFGLGWYGFYWRWRNCFNDQGACFDSTDSVVHHDMSWVLILPTILCLVLAVPGFVVAWRAGRRRA